MNSFANFVPDIPAPLPASGTERVDALLSLAAQMLQAREQQAYPLVQEALHLATEHSYHLGIAEAWRLSGEYHKGASPATAIEHFAQALPLFKTLGDNNTLFKTQYALAGALRQLARYNESQTAYEQAIAIGEQMQHAPSIILAHTNLAHLYARRGYYPLAIRHYKEALKSAQQHNIEIEVARALHNIGESFATLYDYPSALEYLMEAARISRALEPDPLYATCLGSIGLLYMALGRYAIALNYTMQLLNRTEKEGNKVLQAKVMSNIGEIYSKLGNTSTALSYHLKCLRICEEIDEPLGEAETLKNLADLFLQLGNTDDALAYACKALSLAQAMQAEEIEVLVEHTIGRIYKERREYETALLHLLPSLDIATRLELWEQQLHLHTTLAAVYKKAGDTHSSRQHTHFYKQLTQQHFSKEKEETTLRMMKAFEEQKNQQEIDTLQLKSSKHALPIDVFATANQREFEATSKLAPSAEPAVTPDIAVSTFGRFAVVINGRELTPDDWQRKKARDIFKILLINYKKAVSTDEIIEHLWPDAAGKNILPTIWNSISYIRKALEPGIKPQTASSYITVVDKTYILNLGDEASIDFLRFRHLVAEAHRATTPSDRLAYLEKAIDLYTGDFLHEDLYEEWACFERESLKNMYVESLTELANARAAHGDNDRALSFARRTLEIDHTYEEAYEIILTILVTSGQLTEAHKAIKQCREVFHRELACAPPRYIENIVPPLL